MRHRKFYPSCNTQKVIEAGKKSSEDRVSQFPSTDCIVEAISVVMSSNNSEFQGDHYTQVNGAIIEGPDSGSTTDIFGAIFLNEPVFKEGPFQPMELSFDIELDKTEVEINTFTEV